MSRAVELPALYVPWHELVMIDLLCRSRDTAKYDSLFRPRHVGSRRLPGRSIMGNPGLTGLRTVHILAVDALCRLPREVYQV